MANIAPRYKAIINPTPSNTRITLPITPPACRRWLSVGVSASCSSNTPRDGSTFIVTTSPSTKVRI
ncbi:Uncharacterised protein [Vibrio cholerae]|nr:Uncharacterised protein [Vibrio cholerae]CSD24100.1 Uncharacterised protein [Vibrio cholerae]CSH98683.1 Uncharacterised protein [Vibrio cholerae]